MKYVWLSCNKHGEALAVFADSADAKYQRIIGSRYICDIVDYKEQ